jgi:hypothetical protein
LDLEDKMKIKMYRGILGLIVVALMASLACSRVGREQVVEKDKEVDDSVSVVEPADESEQADAAAEPTPAATVEIDATVFEDVHMDAFASYPDVQVKLPAAFEGGYSLPVDLDQVQISESYDISEKQRAYLSANGFVVEPPVPGQFREFYQIYESGRYKENTYNFVTTDSVYHIYHLIFDKMLRELERNYFIPTLETLTQTMLAECESQYDSLKDTSLEEAALRNVAFFSVAAQLLELPDAVPQPAAEMVEAELGLIRAHSGAQPSPIWHLEDIPPDEQLIEDYSQYVPRGHYTRSEELERYFRAMMWYGRLTYRLDQAFETQRALLVTHAMRHTQAADGTPALTLWENIFDPTVFIVGKADDLSCYEYGALSDKVFGADPELASYADDTLFAQFMAAAEQLPPPLVNSMWVWIWQDQEQVTKGFRFMGQRFTLDAYVFGQVMWRKVGTIDNPRDLPKGLDFFAAIGSDEALELLEEMGEPDYLNYSDQMTKVRGEMAQLEIDSWTQNLYWSWLYAFHPMIEPKDQRYPAFMQTQAWTRKDLNTALGSWTELKHDTILYAKQVMAEMGGGASDPVHGYVEPNPEAYARLKSLTQMTYDGLEARSLLDENTRPLLSDLLDLLTFLQTAAEKELAGEALSEDELYRIMFYGGELEYFTVRAADQETPMDRNLEDQQAALVADVATGIDRVLEEAIGQPAVMYVVLPDEPWRVGVGAVFSYYEFEVKPSERMTDETWQEMVAAGDTPPMPDWTGLYIAP